MLVPLPLAGFGHCWGRDQGLVDLSPAGHTLCSGKLQRPGPLRAEWGPLPGHLSLDQAARHYQAQITSPAPHLCFTWLQPARPQQKIKSSNSAYSSAEAYRGNFTFSIPCERNIITRLVGKGGCMPLQHPRRKARQSCSEQGSLQSSSQMFTQSTGVSFEGALGSVLLQPCAGHWGSSGPRGDHLICGYCQPKRRQR